MIRLVALNQDTQTQTTLDLEGAPSISLNLAVAKPGETMQRHAPYSQTFRLPFTSRNNQFFAHFYEVTLTDGDFDPTQKTEVLIFEDGVQVIRGAMQLRAVRLMAEVYEVNVLGDVADLFAEMGSKLLEAAFLDGDDYTTDYNYDLTDANVIASQDLNQSISQGDQVPDGTIIIPLADHGLRADQQPLAAQDNYGLMDPNATTTGLRADMLKPAIKLRVLVDLIIRTNGFYWVSDFFASDLFGDLYMTLASETERAPKEPKFLFRAGTTSAVSIPINLVATIVFNNDSTPADEFFDDDGVYSTLNGTYTCPASANYSFVSSGQIVNGGTFQAVVVRIVAGTTTIASQELVLDASETVDYSVAGTAFIAANVGVQVQTLFTNAAATIDGTFQCTSNGSGSVNVPKALPRIKQKDLMRDLCQRFNLVIEADLDNPKRLYIEPYADWIADGVDTYWTEKLDLDKERTLMPTSSLKSARIMFSDRESNDVGNKFVQDTQGLTFGTYDQDIDDDFATGELKNAPVFAPYFVYPVPTLQGDPTTVLPNVLIHRSYQRDGVGVKPAGQPPKIFFVTGNVTPSETLYIGGTALTSYLLCSPFSSSPWNTSTQSTYWNSRSLTFSVDNALLAGAPLPAIGLHQAYWAGYLADIYDADARVFEAHLYLTPSDIRNVRFNDRFHILGAVYKLTEISGYQIGTGESTLCKFLRDLDRSSFGACSAVPTSSNANGTVTFTDADGTTTTNPGQQCCEAFGYYYDATTNTCRWNNPATDDGNPVPPYPPTDAQDPVPFVNGDTPGPVSPTGTNTNTTDPGSGTVSVYDEVILTGESTGSDTIEPVAPGGAPITVPDNTVAFGVIRSTSTTVGGSAGVAFTSLFDTWRFLANGRAGTVTLTETSGESLSSGTPGARRLTASLSGGVLHIYASGEANKIINWTLSVEMIRMYATNETEFENAIL
ncbi:MAG: hypothetical protein ACO3O3_11115, partial [Ilumatobacteraceae bacterium]